MPIMWATIFIMLAISAAFGGAAYLLRPKAAGGAKPNLGDFRVATTTEDRTIPTFWGKCLLDSPNLIYDGNLSTDEDTIGDQVINYSYVLTFQYGLGLGQIDNVHEIRFENKVAWTGTAAGGGTVTIANTALFGDKGFGGGVSGIVDVMDGNSSQAVNSYLTEATIDALYNVKSITETAPPVSPTHGDEYIPASPATGAWANHENDLMIWLQPIPALAGAWNVAIADTALPLGLTVAIEDESNAIYAWDGTAWLNTATGNLNLHPNYRHMSTLVFRRDPTPQADGSPSDSTGFNVGEGAYLRPMSCVASKYPKSNAFGTANAAYLTATRHLVGDDANPMEILYEVLTGTTYRNGTLETLPYGAGIPAANIDGAGFLAAANTLFTETLGMSMQWNTRGHAREVVDEVMQTVGGILYTDVSTGKITVVLARADYTVASLELFDESNAIEVPNMSRGAWNETANQVNVSYIDRAAGYIERTAKAFDLANRTLQGRTESVAVTYAGITTAANAAILATREIKETSYPYWRGEIIVNREAWDMTPGDVFKFSWARYGIVTIVMRVLTIKYGTPLDGKIVIAVAQDVFSLPDSIYAAVPGIGWVNPVRRPEPVLNQDAFELPFWFWLNKNVMAQLGDVKSDQERIIFCAERPNLSCTHFKIGLSSTSDGDLDIRDVKAMFCPTATLASSYVVDTNPVDGSGTLVVEGGIGMDRISNVFNYGADLNLSIIGSRGTFPDSQSIEFVTFQTISTSTSVAGQYLLVNVTRGLFHTPPMDHASGTRIWFVGRGGTIVDIPFDHLSTSFMVALPVTARGVLESSMAAELEVNTPDFSISRAPYPPGKVQLNGQYYPAALPADQTVTLTWEHRNRLHQKGFVAQNSTDVIEGAEKSSTAYTVFPDLAYYATWRMRQNNGSTYLGSTAFTRTGKSFALPSTARDALGAVCDHLDYELSAWRADSKDGTTGTIAGYLSFPQVRTVDLAGWGLHYGEYYGGPPPP